MDHLISRQTQALVARQQAVAKGVGQSSLNAVAHLMDGVDVGHLEQLGQGRLPRQGQDLCLEGGIQCSLVQNGDKGRQQGVGECNLLPLLHPRNPVDHRLVDQHLGRIPAGKLVAGMAHQEGQGLVAVVIVQLDRGGEVPQQGRYWPDRYPIEFESLLCFQHVQHIANGLALVLQRDDGTLLIVDLDVEGDMQRQLLWLILGRRGVLAHVQTIDTAFGIVFVGHGELGGAGLAVPAAEASEIHPGGILHRLHEVVAGGGRAVVTLEVESHARLEGVLPQQGVHHADHFRALLVDGQGVEVVHLDHHIRADGVGHGAGIFGKLRTAHGAHVVDAVDAARPQIGGELLIPEHRQPLFEA